MRGALALKLLASASVGGAGGRSDFQADPAAADHGQALAVAEVGAPGRLCLGSGPEPHGPYDYPEGCVVFASFRGLSAQHRYDGSPAGEI